MVSRRQLLSVVLAVALVGWRPVQVIGQGAEADSAIQPTSLTGLVEREALRLARSSVAQRQLPPASQPSGTSTCSKRKGALIGAAVGAATAALFAAQAASNRRSGAAGPSAGVIAAQLGVGAGVGALAGALACR